MIDRIEITKTNEAIVRIYDSQDQPLALHYDNLQIYEFNERIWNPKILYIEYGNHDGLNVGELRIFITGTDLGETKLSVTSGNREKMLSSLAYPIQVRS